MAKTANREDAALARRRYAKPPSARPKVFLKQIPGGYAGTKRTVDHMQTLIRQGVRDFYVRQKAIDILLQKQVPPKDYLGEIKALFEWVQSNVRYTRDPYRLEVLHTPRRMLELRAGDCDDMTILLAAMLEGVGHPTRIVLAGTNPARPRLFSHVYLEANFKDRWIALDPTMPFSMGWSPSAPIKEVVHIKRKPHPAHNLKLAAGNKSVRRSHGRRKIRRIRPLKRRTKSGRHKP